MSSTRDPELEVNEKLLVQKPSNNNQNMSPPYNNSHPPPHQHRYSNNIYPPHSRPSSNTNPSTSSPAPTQHMTSSNNDLRKAIVPDTALDLQRQIDRLKIYIFALLGVLVAFAVVSIAVAAGVMVQFRDDLDHHTHKPKVGEEVVRLIQQQESMCVPCKDYRLGPSPEEERMLNKFSQKDTEEGLMCCVDTPQELLDLLKLFVEQRFRQERAKGTIDFASRATKTGDNQISHAVAAHLLMTAQTEGVTQMRGRQYTIDKWVHKDDMAFTIGATYRHGRIVIPSDGFYFVYSQISFMEFYTEKQVNAFHSKAGADSPSLSHYIYRYNINYRKGPEEKLSQNSITKCWGQSRQFGEYTSYLGSVFYLREADEIFIKVSNITMVNTDAKLSYFGLFKI